ncbi:hypothetical protein [Streptococcus salivarius]
MHNIKKYFFEKTCNRKKEIPPIVSNINAKIQKLRKKNNRLTIRKDSLLYYLLFNTYGIQKYEVDSQYPYHKSVPSTRGLFTISINIIEYSGGKYFISEFDNYSNSLVNLRCFEGDTLNIFRENLIEAKTVVVFSFDFNILAPIYGEFFYQLTLLDCGHIIKHMALLLDRKDIDYKIITTLGEDEYQLNSLFLDDNFALAVMVIDAKEKNDYLDFCKETLNLSVTTSMFQKYFPDTFEIYRLTHRSKFPSILPISSNPFFLRISEDFFKDLQYNRTSAHNPIGLSGFVSFDWENKKNQIIDFCISLHMERIKLYVFSINDCSCYRISHGKVKQLGGDFSELQLDKFLFMYKTGITLDSLDFIIWLTFDIDDLDTPDSYHLIHFEAGGIMQEICLFMSQFYYFCRPIKNNNENFFKEIFETELIYTACIGNTIYDNITVDLR